MPASQLEMANTLKGLAHVSVRLDGKPGYAASHLFFHGSFSPFRPLSLHAARVQSGEGKHTAEVAATREVEQGRGHLKKRETGNLFLSANRTNATI